LKVKPVVPRELASRDIREVIAYYLSEATAQAAMKLGAGVKVPA